MTDAPRLDQAYYSAAELDRQIDAINASQGFKDGDPATMERRTALYQQRWGAPPLDKLWGPAVTPAVDNAVADIVNLRQELARNPSDTVTQRKLEEAYKAMDGTGEADDAEGGDPAIDKAMAELRALKPDSPEWAKKVDEIDARVLAQPVSPETVSKMQEAAAGLPLPDGAAWDTQELGRVVNVANFNLGPEAGEAAVISGMQAVRRALADAQRPATWAEGADSLTEWDGDAEKRVADIREAWVKLPPAARSALTKAKIQYHPAVLRFLAEVGSKIPLAPQ